MENILFSFVFLTLIKVPSIWNHLVYIFFIFLSVYRFTLKIQEVTKIALFLHSV